VTAAEIAGLAAALVPSGAGGWLVRRLWRDLTAVRKELRAETDARIAAGQECDARIESAISAERRRADDFESKFTGATTRMQGRIDALEARCDLYVEKRVDDQARTAAYLGEIANRTAEALDRVAAELRDLPVKVATAVAASPRPQ
jgi:hypothetical protein